MDLFRNVLIDAIGVGITAGTGSFLSVFLVRLGASDFMVLSCYVLTGLAPFFVRDHAPEVIIVIWALVTLPQTLVSVGFTVVMGGVAGPAGRFTLMTRRWAILGLTNSLTVVLVDQGLRQFGFPLNYRLVFLASTVGALISVVFSSSIRLPPQPVTEAREGLIRTLSTG